ncbi:MAG: SusC/RagA family TonB-linked outer membrane protein, partial [Cyclobacteriaceae bacterium]
MKFKLIQGIKLMSKFVLYGIVAQLFLLEMLLADGSNAQSVKSVKEVNVSLTVKNVSLEEVFKSVEQQTEFRFTYDIKDVRAVNNVSISLKNASVYDLLENLAKENSFHFRQVNRDIDVKKVGRRSAAKETVEVVLQTISISGRVSSSDTPEGLPGVNVVVKGTAQGTVTDMDGRYTLDVAGSESILVFSSVGYLTEEVVVGGRSVLDMSLTLDVTALEEIVVVGYSEQTRASLTTAVSTVKGKDLINQSTGDVRKALQGTVPGLTIVDQGGAPGQQDVQIRIRGISSVNNTNPLVLVDGMEQQLINVDANAIESVTVLKDAASTAIYGSRGANGVILITTIKGQEGKLRVAYNGFYGTSFPTRRPEAIDTRRYMEMQNLAWANSNNPNVPWPDIDGYLENMRNYPDLYPKAFPGNDEFFNWAPVAKHSVVLSGGSKNIQTMFNLAYEDQASIIPGSHSDRIQLRSNNDFRLNDNIKTFVNISYNRLNSESPNNINQWYYQLMMEPSEFQNQRFPDGTYGFSN